jgi:hypothetical protein
VNDQQPSSNYDVDAPQTPSAAGSGGGTTRQRVSPECAPDGSLVSFILASSAQSDCNPTRTPKKNGWRVKRAVTSCLSQRDYLGSPRSDSLSPSLQPEFANVDGREAPILRFGRPVALVLFLMWCVAVSLRANARRLLVGTKLLDHCAISRLHMRFGGRSARTTYIANRELQREVLNGRAAETAP